MENTDIIRNNQITFGEEFTPIPDNTSFRPPEDQTPGRDQYPEMLSVYCCFQYRHCHGNVTVQ